MSLAHVPFPADADTHRQAMRQIRVVCATVISGRIRTRGRDLWQTRLNGTTSPDAMGRPRAKTRPFAGTHGRRSLRGYRGVTDSALQLRTIPLAQIGCCRVRGLSKVHEDLLRV